MTLRVTVSETVEGPEVALAGDLALDTVGRLRGELIKLVGSAEPGTRVRVDLSGLTLLDSSGLSVLITAHKIAVERGASVVLASPPDHVERTLRITGLHEVLDIAVS
ncbi:STAS domain-containing protein [Prauserella cavernicola]|uniref:Anti-sigma factor antagonist n=1 Tax=Prauserella cavernicola TaxID=2800127 RepID=A0A934V7I9_9PSEU|nr:STAS domain-containing protein [Prauserella cavernicola]MBK1787749.1 STAS domain-containing protein [Prauserella cavernicola]